MRLGIVGHGQEKFSATTEADTRSRIAGAIIDLNPSMIVSGHSPMGGVDWYAEDAAKDFGIETAIFAPTVNQWDPPGEYGYKARNFDIALHSDLLMVFVVKDYPPFYKGVKFDGCYHCKGRNPPHIKSGACWTAWKATKRSWEII